MSAIADLSNGTGSLLSFSLALESPVCVIFVLSFIICMVGEASINVK